MVSYRHRKKRGSGYTLKHTTTTKYLYRIERKAICFFRFIFEGYDGVAVVETIDPAAGVIAVHVAPGCESLAEAIIGELSRDHLLEPLPANAGPDDAAPDAEKRNAAGAA